MFLLPFPACGERVGARGSLHKVGKRWTRGESPSPGSPTRHSRSFASAFLRTAAEGGPCLSPHPPSPEGGLRRTRAGRGEASSRQQRNDHPIGFGKCSALRWIVSST